VFGNSITAVVMRLDQNGDITIPKVLSVGGNAYHNNIAGKSDIVSQEY
jgi:hypothetical protein